MQLLGDGIHHTVVLGGRARVDLPFKSGAANKAPLNPTPTSGLHASQPTPLSTYCTIHVSHPSTPLCSALKSDHEPCALLPSCVLDPPTFRAAPVRQRHCPVHSGPEVVLLQRERRGSQRCRWARACDRLCGYGQSTYMQNFHRKAL